MHVMMRAVSVEMDENGKLSVVTSNFNPSIIVSFSFSVPFAERANLGFLGLTFTSTPICQLAPSVDCYFTRGAFFARPVFWEFDNRGTAPAHGQSS
jgi:hypothetical protein